MWHWFYLLTTVHPISQDIIGLKGGGGSDWLNIQIQKNKEKINVGFLIVLIIGTASCIIKNLINEGI